MGVISFNGNKIITAGGGGCIITNNEELSIKAKHLTTTAKLPHQWEFNHDQIGYNYRMPNLNAALLVAQLEKLDLFLSKKREVAEKYKAFFKESDIIFAEEIRSAKSNYWLNSIVFENLKHRNLFLDITNSANISTRPAWTLMNKLPMFKDCQKDGLKNSIWLESRIVNIPSSPIFVIK
jgi:dTDP-4-amino-4,6-dideoxygalactose transaminase